MANEDAPQDTKTNNDQVARQVAAQDIAGQSTVTGEFGEATAALDKLAAQVVPKDPPKVDDTPEPKPKADAPPPPKKDDAPPPPKPDAPPAPTPEETALKQRAETLFKDAPVLPPNASPKSAEAFSTIKQRAAKEIVEREKQIDDLKAKLEAAGKPTQEILESQRELENLREWRAKMDVDFDPRFKEFDKGIAQSRDFIYAQLSKSPQVTPEVIAQIKKYGGPDMVNMAKIFDSLKDSTLQRLVESKVADIEMAKYNREQAVTAAKANLGQYLQERQTQLAQSTEVGKKETSEKLGAYLGRLDWFAEKKLAADADEAAKKDAADHNEFLGTLKKQIDEAAKDDTPEMRAILITGMAQLFHLQRQVPALKAQLADAVKRADEATTKWETIRKNSRSVLPESQAPAGGIPASQRSGVDVNERASDALDKIAQQVMEKRAAANT